MGTRLSLRPDLDQDVGLLALYVSGNLPNAKPEVAYEGRLKIHNAEGACTAEQIGGDTLPPGSSVFVDNATQQVVVAWPAYAEFVTPLQNPSFESGDLSGWTLTPKGGAATATADTSQKFDGAYSLRWPGGKGLGSEGGIEVEAWNNTIGPCLPGQRVTSHARCMYNPGGHNFGSRYQGLLRFLDGAGMPIGPAVRGKLFKGRGNNGRWNDASATGVGPVGTKGVQMGAWLTGSNAPVWLDASSWDVPSSAGINIETTLNLTLRVRDSAGRTALWSGSISVIDWTLENLGLKFWLDDSSDGVVTPSLIWKDKTENLWDATLGGTGTGTAEFVNGQLNGKRIVRFNPHKSLDLPVSARTFAAGVNTAWIFAVARTRVLNAGRFIVNVENGLTVNSNNRLALVLGNWGGSSNVVQALSRRLDSDAREDLISTPVPVGEWVMCLVAADYAARELSLYVNGALSAKKTSAWSGGGPSSATNSIRVTVGAAIINSGPSSGGISNALDGDIACLMGGSGDSLPAVEDFTKLFAWYAERYGLHLA